MSASSTYKLQYFPLQGRAELQRIIMEIGSLPYKNDHPAWPDFKPNTPYGQLPVLVINQYGDKNLGCYLARKAGIYPDVKLAQSGAITRFLAKKAGLMPVDELAAAVNESIVDDIAELTDEVLTIQFKTPKEKVQEAKSKFVMVTLPDFIKTHTPLINEQGHYYSDQLTLADVALYRALDMVHDIVPGALSEKNAEALIKVYQNVAAHPKVKAYRDSDRVLPANFA
ncbi:hypothetical protein HK102_002394 [Quaeritorhiza haematococci]|nr:hypothetical protein HK102_002394 [Quaeritorhiza haematococci]